jgi:hypothetical protein
MRRNGVTATWCWFYSIAAKGIHDALGHSNHQRFSSLGYDFLETPVAGFFFVVTHVSRIMFNLEMREILQFLKNPLHNMVTDIFGKSYVLGCITYLLGWKINSF